MAARKTNNKNSKNNPPRGAQAMVIFWLVFVIVIIGVFMANAPTIQKNFNLFKSRLTTSPGAEELPEEPDEVAVQEQPPARIEPAPQKPAAETSTTPQTTRQDTPEPIQEKPAQPVQQPKQETPKPPAVPQPVQTRDRNVYFTQIDKDGQILQSRVTRKVPVSDSPMIDTLNVLLTGPSSDELNKGILNLIPQNTRILSATVRGSTAYISFSEDFLFNTFGVEGYVAQLRQIVWTVTEFPNVSDIQILVEGRRLDYLGEGIWIGSPIGRQSF
ncbi:MAG: GerMN domain-containing protein [Treponema sp.]|nr:GerMN domain-containing protein [Treponema sp.]